MTEVLEPCSGTLKMCRSFLDVEHLDGRRHPGR